MWRNYDPAVVGDELRGLAENGLTMTRSFFFWPGFMPEPGTIGQEMTDRFADRRAVLAAGAGLTAMGGEQMAGSCTIDPFGIIIVTVTGSGAVHA